MAREAAEKAVNGALDRVQQHPFIVCAHDGTLPRANAERWVFCAGRESRTFPEILREQLLWSQNPKVREILEENLADELGNGDPDDAHFLHYLKLLDALGIEHSRFYDYKQNAGINLALSLAYNVAGSKSPEMSIGYMLVNEAMTPVTYEAARHALTTYHPGLETDFFDLHIEVDEHHVAALYDAVDALGDSHFSTLMFGITLGQRGMEVLLDEAYGVFDPYPEQVTISGPGGPVLGDPAR